MPIFKKEVPEVPIYLPVGKPVRFDAADRDFGFLRTEDGYIVSELRKMIATGRGGVSEIGADEYEEFLKKKASTNWQLSQQQQRQTIGPSSRTREAVNRNAVPAAASVVGVTAGGAAIASFAQPQKTDGLKVERTFVMPKVGRANDQS